MESSTKNLWGAHQHQKHGEDSRPLLRANSSSGVDNEANYAHSPPKGCCTATAKLVGV